MASSTASWRSTFASLKGSSHGGDSPNQDAVRVEQFTDGGDTNWIAAVADGHGGPRYVRSEVGSRTAVDVAVETVKGVLTASDVDDPDPLRTAAPLIVDAWRTAVLAHLAQHPFTDDEAARAGSVVGANPVLAYGATLLISVVNSAGDVWLAQIGDGDALVRTHGFAVRPIPGDDRLIANETTSLCLDTAATDFRFAELPSSAEVDLVLLASDGYGNSFAAKDWWHTLVGDVAWYVDVHGFEEFSTHLPDWLAESALVGGDDVTAAVLSLPVEARPAPVVIPVSPAGGVATAETPVPVPTPTTVAEPAAGRSRRGLVAVLLVALLAGAAAAGAYGLMSRNGDPTGPTTPTTSISPSPTDSGSPSPSGSGSSSPSEPTKKKKKKTVPGGPASGDIEQPPAEVPDRPTDPDGTSKSDPGAADG